jgi:hypothetical protein
MAPPLSSRKSVATPFCSLQAAVLKGERTLNRSRCGLNAMASHFNTEAMDLNGFDHFFPIAVVRTVYEAAWESYGACRHRGCDQDSLRAEDILDAAQHR